MRLREKTEKLKLCPFCGGWATASIGFMDYTYIKCTKCGATMFFDGSEEWNAAIKAFNRRAK